MKMAKLSETTGVPVATIKFYIRAGLLQGGERSLPNQADYGDAHVQRLRLIRGLIEVGGLTVAASQRVIEAIDSDIPLAETFEIAQQTVSDELDQSSLDPAALSRIDELLSGWHYHSANPGRLAAARVLTTFEAVGQQDERGWFKRYAEAALLAAEADVDELETRHGREAQAETVVIGTVLGDALFAALRRAAQEHASSLRFSTPLTSEIPAETVEDRS